MTNDTSRIGLRLFALIVSVMCVYSFNANAQDLIMRRSNSIGNWIAYLNNTGALFNQSDSAHPSALGMGAGGLWTRLGRNDTVVFGAGLWIGGLRRRSGTLTPHVEFSYNPNTGQSQFSPGSLVYDGPATDASQAARDKYRVYRSTDLAGPPWPVRSVNGRDSYIDDVTQRDAAGPQAVLGDEDMFLIYKDSDPDSSSDPFDLEIRTQASFWKSGFPANVVLVRNQMVYSGNDTIFNPILALAVDGDINIPDDDRTKGVQNEGTQATVFFTDQSTTDPLLGVMVLDGQNGSNRFDPGVTSLRYWDINDDPVSDSDRYAFLTEIHHDTALSVVGDARILMTSASETPLVPGDTLYFTYALFAQAPTGPALTAADSAAMLRTARTISSNYRSGTLGSLSGVEHSANKQNIEIYPSPASTELTIDNASGDAELFDELGRPLKAAKNIGNSAVFDVRDLSNGFYFVRIGQNSYCVEIYH